MIPLFVILHKSVLLFDSLILYLLREFPLGFFGQSGIGLVFSRYRAAIEKRHVWIKAKRYQQIGSFVLLILNMEEWITAFPNMFSNSWEICRAWLPAPTILPFRLMSSLLETLLILITQKMTMSSFFSLLMILDLYLIVFALINN